MVDAMFSQQHLPERLANLNLFRGFLAYGEENTYLVASLTDLVNKSASVRTIDPIDTKPTWMLMISREEYMFATPSKYEDGVVGRQVQQRKMDRTGTPSMYASRKRSLNIRALFGSM